MINNIFTSADMLVPPFAAGDSRWEKWAVIACDQFTSAPEYWAEAEKLTDAALTTLDLILPEAYLETPAEESQRERISAAMKRVPAELESVSDAFVYLERILPDGGLRRGIVGKIDLECYDYSEGSTSAIRATEKTVVERIPPRVAVRRGADIELPHVMLFCDDPDNIIMGDLDRSKLTPLYDFSLMLGGGHATGYLITGEARETLAHRIAEYEATRESLIYAVGDGNHSLASAKAFYEEIKAALGEAAKEHPARYALVELVNLHEASIEFEPIYRLLKNVDAEAFLSSLPAEGREVRAVYGGGEKNVYFPSSHALTMGSMQIYIDAYLEAHPEVKCDYIHGLEECEELGRCESSLALICGGIEKAELFSYCEQNGTLPRKTFSMGEAKSKRYYIEARYIK